MPNSRCAARVLSDVPASVRGGGGSAGSSRNCRASPMACLSVGSLRVTAMRSSKSPCSAVAASHHLPAREPGEPHVEAPPGDCHIANPPIAAVAMTIRKIVPTDRFGVLRQSGASSPAPRRRAAMGVCPQWGVSPAWPPRVEDAGLKARLCGLRRGPSRRARPGPTPAGARAGPISPWSRSSSRTGR